MVETAYDRVAYPGKFFVQSSPDRLGVLGRLRGLETAGAERARVLEIGCGDGNNLIPFANRFPGASVVGIDNSTRAIAAARARAEASGLGNARFVCEDLRSAEIDKGSYDYVIAHGVFSWVDDEAREALLDLCAHSLAPAGIAYISYATLPGALFRSVARDMARFHVRAHENPAERIAGARQILSLAATQGAADPRLSDLARRELDAVAGKDFFLLHDMLSDDNEPFYFLDFAALAAEHGLAYLSEAQSSASAVRQLEPASRDFVASVPNPLEREQYFDFLFLRQFRCDVLCRIDAAPTSGPALEMLETLCISSAIRPAGGTGQTEFEHPAQGRLTAEHPVAAAFANALSAVGHRAVRYPELLTAAALRLGRPFSDEDKAQCAAFLLAMFERAFCELRTVDLTAPAGSRIRPQVSELNRILAGHGEPVVTLELNTFYLPTDYLKRLVPLLDGSRTQDDLLMEMSAGAPGSEIDGVQRLASALDFLAMNAMLLPG